MGDGGRRKVGDGGRRKVGDGGRRKVGDGGRRKVGMERGGGGGGGRGEVNKESREVGRKRERSNNVCSGVPYSMPQ